MKRLLGITILLGSVFFWGCSIDGRVENTQQPPPFVIGKLKKNIENPMGMGADGPTYTTQKQGKNQAPRLNSKGLVIYIVCFFGPNDKNNVAQNMCATALAQCQATFGAACQRVDNPTPQQLQQLNSQVTSIVYVVTHSTPGNTTDPSGIDIWDTQCTPGQISQKFCGTPVVWYGCYGYDIQTCYNNVVSPQTQGEILDSTNPTVTCMMKAITYCANNYAIRGTTFTNNQLQACARRNMRRMPGCARVPLPPLPKK